MVNSGILVCMAEATSPEDAVRQIPALLRRMGLARPAADAKAREILDQYTGTYLVLSDLSAQLRTHAPRRPFRVRLPVATMMAAGEANNARTPSELNRQANGHPPQPWYPCHGQLRHTTSPSRIHRDPGGRPAP
jgi:hypothetical protein